MTISVTRVSYDYTNLDDDTYIQKYTAYAALIDKTAVCQGYASLLYRMVLDAGVDARVISGDAGGPHAWNIVRLNGKYYNLDTLPGMPEENYSSLLSEKHESIFKIM
ncbi:MAG: transglutaminase domain-containing protein [Dorea sp.]